MSASGPVRGALLTPLLVLAALCLPACAPPPADPGPAGRSLVLAHFFPPLSSARTSVVLPFTERLEERSGGRLTVTEYLGGALGSAPRRYYSLVLDGVADIVVTLPGYTAEVFPRTTLSGYPGVCQSGIGCTAALRRALPDLEEEYAARILAIWSAPPPVLLTRERPVRRLEDFRGLKLRVSSRHEVPFVEALGASAVMQPISDLQQSLHTGVIDGVVTTVAGVLTYQLQEAASFLTTWTPLSAVPFVLLMNRDAYAALSVPERSWLDGAADASLSISGARAYQLDSDRYLRMIHDAGVELIDLSDAEKARLEGAVESVYRAEFSRRVGDMTVGEIIDLFRGP